MDADSAVVAAQVTAYLARHPHAADTATGIAMWWIPGGLWLRPGTVQEALDHLVATGQLAARRLPSGESLYSMRMPAGSDDP